MLSDDPRSITGTRSPIRVKPPPVIPKPVRQADDASLKRDALAVNGGS
jgi:hypothetical protein